MKLCVLRWLPTLLSSLGSFSFNSIPDYLKKCLNCGVLVLEEVGRSLGSLACVLTEHTEVVRRVDASFNKPVCETSVLFCPVCDNGGNTKGV